MKLLRMSKGVDLLYSETIRYFSLPKNYAKLLKILESKGYQSNSDVISLLGSTSFVPLHGEYKTLQSNENERMAFTFEQLSLNPLIEVLNSGLQVTLFSKDNSSENKFLWFEVVDSNEVYELFTHNYASMLFEIPMTKETKSDRLKLQREYERELRLLKEYHKAL